MFLRFHINPRNLNLHKIDFFPEFNLHIRSNFEPSLGKDGETMIVAASKMGWAMVISQQSSLLNFVAFWSFSWSINAMVLFCLYIWVAFITLSDPTRSSWSTLWSIPYWNLIIRPCESIRARNGPVFDSSSELDSLELCLFRVKLGQLQFQENYEMCTLHTFWDNLDSENIKRKWPSPWAVCVFEDIVIK